MNQTQTLQRIDRSNVLDLPVECVSDIALRLPNGLSYTAWAGVGARVHKIQNATPWWLGDWILSGEANHPQTYAQAIEERSAETLRQAAWVCSRIEPARRRVELSFSHHRVVAKLGVADQDRWLKWAVENNASKRELEAQVNAERVADGIEEPKPERIKLDKDAIKDFSISAIGQPWTTEQHNALMAYLNVNHCIERIGD